MFRLALYCRHMWLLWLSLCCCIFVYAQDEVTAINCSAIEIRSPWSQEYPICWMKKDAFINALWPKDTFVSLDYLGVDYPNDGAFFTALDALKDPRTTNVCVGE